jgi:hypothetical protein
VTHNSNRAVALKRWRLMDGEFPSLLGAMRSGEIRCLKGQTNRMQVGDVLLDRESVRRWREKRRVQRDEYLSIDMAARVLGVKQEVAYHLVRCKALASASPKTGSAPLRVSKLDLQDFRSKYISLVELARLRKHSPKAALGSLCVKPAIGPHVDGCRQYFFLRSDLSVHDAM